MEVSRDLLPFVIAQSAVFIHAINNWKKQVYEHKLHFFKLHSRDIQLHFFFLKPSLRAGKQYHIFLCAYMPLGLMEAAQTVFVTRPLHGQQL